MIFATASSLATAEPLTLPSYKDALFAYPGLTAYRDDGRYVDVDYSETRDIDQRDAVPERRVRPNYVSRIAAGLSHEQTLPTEAGPLPVATVGDTAHPHAIVVFIHGRGGDRRLGMNDWTFGGNFNRLKNLMVKAGGLYVTADAGAFQPDDAARIRGLLEQLGRNNPGTPLVLACGSMGGELCWQLAGEPFFARSVNGFVLLGGNSSLERYRRMHSAAGTTTIPLVMAQGTEDSVYPWSRQKAAFDDIRKAYPQQPVRFVSFDGGSHGTPIRMIDWRTALNWIFASIR
ncbi:alpha/beta hydrolase family protein [Consotaella aegiceratis]|uniref:alpha/beta hydrolase family protein n=1 Tax=Consotaella aegiceratis TaxID=3097961 RepID=UPI002F3F353F